MTAHTGDMAVAVRSGNQGRITALQDELKGLNAVITR